ncbi:MAG: GDSL-type esterase/lipase family protein [Pirellulales bacterium]
MYRTLCLVFLLVSALTKFASAAEPAAPQAIKVVLVGDSTVTDTAGWGGAFGELLQPPAVCVNHAKGGASTKSYYASNLWKAALAEKPDYLFIQFGHNDMPGKGPHRETDAATTYRENLKLMIGEARAKGAEADPRHVARSPHLPSRRQAAGRTRALCRRGPRRRRGRENPARRSLRAEHRVSREARPRSDGEIRPRPQEIHRQVRRDARRWRGREADRRTRRR